MVKEGYKKVQLGIKETLIPDQWLVKSIDNIVDLKLNSVDPSKLNRKSVKLYSMPAFDENKEPKIIDPKEIGSSKYLVPKECLLFAKLNPRKKRIWLINNEVDYSLCSTEFWPLVKKDENINLDFLHYYFFSYDFQSNPIIKPASSTNSHKRIKRKSFKKVNIPIPPLPEQKKISSILSSADKSIEKTDEVIEETKELKNGLMQELLTKGIGHSEFKKVRVGPINYEIPINWKTEKLGDISKVKRGASPRPIASDKWFDENSNIGWVRISDITSAGKYLKETEQYLSSAGIDKSRKANKGEVILSICATVGKPSILDIDTCIHDGLVLFRNNKDKILNEFLYYVLLRNQQILKSKGQTGTQANLNTSIVKRTEILLPPLEEQKKIVSILSSVDAEIQKEEEYKAKLERLKKGLMQKLLTGEVRVNTEMEV